MEFWVNLIVVAKEQSINAMKSLKGNCTHVDNWCWIFEGEIWCLEEDGVKFNVVTEGAVPALGGLPTEKLVEICEYWLDVDVYDESYQTQAKQTKELK